MFSDIVLSDEHPKLKKHYFEEIFDELKQARGAKGDTDVDAAGLKELAGRFKQFFHQQYGADFPSDPQEQLRLALLAVFNSWNNKRAFDYRNFNKIPHDLGTAVNVQAMVFGNMGDDSGTGVAFTRDVATGAKRMYGEYLMNAQGEDVVAGVRTPVPISELERDQPQIYAQFLDIAQRLEKHYRDVQDLEFTIEKGRLFILQCRSGKRTAAAAVKIAVDLVHEGMISKEEALSRGEPSQIDQLLLPRFDPKAKQAAVQSGRLLAKGLNASPGAATGLAIFSADRAAERGGKGERVVLVRPETNPDDVHGMLAARGILTARGGATSHAAVVARGLGLPCVAGCETVRVDEEARRLSVDGRTLSEGEEISIDGTTGEVFEGVIPTIDPSFDEETDLRTLLEWADEVKRLGVWANADYPRDARRAIQFGARGIGLCRTEHMFMEQERLPIVQEMILADTPTKRKAALDRLLPFQRSDFKGIFEAMGEYPVVIRLIDPPLHEFLPSHDELLEEVTRLDITRADPAELAEKRRLLQAVEAMRQVNPMLGLRGCRLRLVVPEIVEMQVRAILEAACAVKKQGIDVHPKIMIPLVGHVNELKRTREILEPVAQKVQEEQGVQVDYKFGTMIEIPRAALTADQIAEVAEFFSFGTNDLTQTTFGFSRDDAEGKFLLKYVDEKILPVNPFQIG